MLSIIVEGPFRRPFGKKREGDNELTDGEIIRLLKERDERAISEVERKYSAYLRTVAFNVLGNDPDAEECVNDALMNVWKRSGESTPVKLKQYLAAVTRNIAINRFKEKTRQKRRAPNGETVVDDETASLPGGGDPLDRLTLTALINEYLHTLPLSKRRIFVARYYYDADPAEIAAKLGIPAGTVNSTLDRVKKGLRKYLQKEGFDV